MRITYLSPVGVIGGAERVLLSTILGACSHLPSLRISLILFADGPLRAKAERLGANVEVVPLPARLAKLGETDPRESGHARSLARLGWNLGSATPAGFKFVRDLRAALRLQAPDLIHSNGLKSHILSILAKPRGVPVFWHLHDFQSDRPVMARLLRLLVSGAAGGIAISEAVGRDASSSLPGLAISVVRNSVDSKAFSQADRDGAGLDRLAGLPDAESGTLRVGMVATYANWKGHSVFLKALGRLGSAATPVRGYIVGGPIYTTSGSQLTRAGLERLVAENGLVGQVGFIPFQPDPADVYRMLDVVVHASTRPEPFGLTIAEAMACGRAVIVAAAGGATELFTEGHDALGHIQGDAEGLAGAIGRLAGNPELRRRLGSNARRTAVERFSPERYDREIAKVYEACLRGERPHDQALEC